MTVYSECYKMSWQNDTRVKIYHLDSEEYNCDTGNTTSIVCNTSTYFHTSTSMDNTSTTSIAQICTSMV